MGAALQLFKDFFLLLTTGYIIFWFFKDYRKALIWYLFFYGLIAVIGLHRVIYNQNIIIPLLLIVTLSLKSSPINKTNTFYVVFFIYMLFITYVNELIIIDAYSKGAYLLVALLIFSNYLFKNADYAIKIVFFIWLITISFAFNSIIYGEDMFNVSAINSEERSLIIDTGVQGSRAQEEGVDLNYYSSTQAIGAMISILFLTYRKELLAAVSIPITLKRFLYSKAFTLALFFLLAIEIWLMIRGLSRGGLLIFLSGLIGLLFILRKQKYLIWGAVLLIGLYFVMEKIGIIDLFLERMTRDQSGTSGRDLIMLGVFSSVYSQGGIMQIIFGGGNAWPWWDFWGFNPWDSDKMVSSHNQWLSIFVNFGLVGLSLFIIPLYNGIRNCLKNKNPINNIRIVLFICVFFFSMSLEPLIFTHYVWFIFALAATYTPNRPIPNVGIIKNKSR